MDQSESDFSLSDEEYRQHLRDGLFTLRAECLARPEDSRDPELFARFLALHEFWFWGARVKPDRVPRPFRNFGVREIAAYCTLVLRREGLEGQQ